MGKTRTSQNRSQQNQFSFLQSLLKVTNHFLYFAILVAVSGIVFFPILFNGFALDDFPQIVNRPYVHTPLHIINFFTESIRVVDQSGFSLYAHYRPIQFSLFAMLFAVGHGSAFPFHLFQILLYTANAILVFLFLSSFFNKRISFFLALVFLIHPDNTEVAAYISSSADTLFFFFGMASLVVATQSKQTSRTFFASFILLTLSILSKEVGFLFLLIVPFYAYLFQKFNKYKSVALFILPLVTYGVLHTLSSFRYLFTFTTLNHIHTTLGTQFLIAPQVILFYLKDFFMPAANIPTEQSFQASVTQDAIPLLVITAILFCFGTGAYALRQHHKPAFKPFLFFGVWLGIGLLFYMQIIPFDVVVAKRFLYFPMIGILGIAGSINSYTTFIPKPVRVILYILLFLLILLYLAYTIRLNSYWHNLKCTSEGRTSSSCS